MKWVLVCVSLVVLSGCGARETRPFLDQKKEVAAGLEWNREITSARGGTIRFNIESQGPFSLTVATGAAFAALRNGKPIQKEDVLLSLKSSEPRLEKTLTVPAGSTWFIIRNDTSKTVEFHLQAAER